MTHNPLPWIWLAHERLSGPVSGIPFEYDSITILTVSYRLLQNYLVL